MSADLHIHAFVGVSEEDLALFFNHAIGSKKWGSLEDEMDDM